MKNVDFLAVAREVNAQVAYYSRRRKRSSVLEEDLRGHAWDIALDALQRYDPAKGRVGPYLGGILRKQIANYLILTGSPAHGSIRHARDALCKARSVPVLADREKAEDGSPAPGVVLEADESSWAEQVLADEGWRERVAARLKMAAGDEGAEGLAVLLGEKSPRNWPKRIRESVQVARERIAADGWLATYWGATDHERLVALRLALSKLVPGVAARCGGRIAVDDLAHAALRLGFSSDELRAEYAKGRMRSPEEREASVLVLLRPGTSDPEAHLRTCVVLRRVFPGDEPGDTYETASYLARIGVGPDLLERVADAPGGWENVSALVGECWR